MSGGGEEHTSRKSLQKAPIISGSDDLSFALTKMAVAQVCESLGFQGFRESAIEGLTDIAVRYLRELGKTSSHYANLAGRTECNVFDVVRGLDDLSSSQSEVNHCSLSSGTLKEIAEYAESCEEMPLAQSVPRFPVTINRKAIPSFLQMGETPPGKHIPEWLPAFPDPHTYIHSPVWKERRSDPRSDKIEQAKQRRKAERSLLSLQERLTQNGAVTSLSLPNQAATSSSSLLPESNFPSNPYLSTPLEAGEKEVSEIFLPSKLGSKEGGSVLEAFAPAIDALKVGVSELDDGDRMDLPEKRAAINFKFSSRKKMFGGSSSDLAASRRGSSQTLLPVGRADEKDDKKRRAELILRQSMENPQELAQL